MMTAATTLTRAQQAAQARARMAACYGIGCPMHGQCQLYAAVEQHSADETQGTCDDGQGGRPAFRAIATLAVLAAIATSTPATAQTEAEPRITLGAHTLTWHDRPGFKATTPGLYVTLGEQLSLGALRNSHGKLSTYAAWTWHGPQAGAVQADLTAGAITGYDLAPVVPLIAPSLAWRITDRTTLRAIALPRWHPKQGASAVQLAVEYRIGG